MVRLKREAARGFFEVQDALSASKGEQISGSSTFEWLLSGCKERIASLLKSFSSPVKVAKQLLPKELPEECKGRGFMELLLGVSPSRTLPALRKREGTIFDEKLGFLDFKDDPDILECLAEEVSYEMEEPKSDVKPKFFFGEVEKLEEFFQLHSPLCQARDCGRRMSCEKVGFMHQTVIVHLSCEAGHSSVWRSAEEMRGSQHSEVVLQAFHSVLCSGGGFTEYEEFSRELGLKLPAERLFFEF